MAIKDTAQQIVTSSDFSMLSSLNGADFIGKLVILLLVISSIWAWAIIISKLLHYSAIKKRMRSFENLFWSGKALDELYEGVKQHVDNPLSAVFISSIKECKKSKISDSSKSDFFVIGYKERVLSSMYLSKNRAIEKLESKLSFLATIGSAAPFIGLFGTVWGIMHSFQSIATSKNTSLAVVAPGIAEALFATAVGLFAAIPASIFYNYLSSSVDNIDNRVDNFISELNALLSRAIDEDKM